MNRSSSFNRDLRKKPLETRNILYCKPGKGYNVKTSALSGIEMITADYV